MKGERGENSLHVYLSADDVYSLQAGKPVTERLSITTEGAKVSVTSTPIPREDQFPLDRLEQAQTLPLTGSLYTNEDLDIDVPAIALVEGPVSARQLTRDTIRGDKDQIEHVIPQGGVVVHFGGALRLINIPDYFEQVSA